MKELNGCNIRLPDIEPNFIGLQGELNTYGYVDNDSLKYIDPYGLSKLNKLYGLSE